MAMTWEDYKDQVMSDARYELESELESYVSYYDDFSEIFDNLMICDNVTGNGSGSYTFNTWQAMDNLSEIIWDEDFIELFNDYGYDGIPMEKGPESIDVIVRCLALDELYSDIEKCFEGLLIDNQAKLAEKYVTTHSNLSPDSVEPALEYLSESTDGTLLELAREYAGALYELNKYETVEEWMKHHPNDTVIINGTEDKPTVILSDDHMYL